MPLVRVIRNRGANIVVEANAEILFLPGGDVNRWNRRLTNEVKKATAFYAPTNKRPRWAHYGAPLKSTIRGTSRANPSAFRIDSAVGSTAPHAYYVDQGTKPFMAKILPPWTRGGPTLYEHTYKVPESDSDGVRFHEVGKVPVSGQRAQEFFDKGLRRGFQVMRMQTTTGGLPGITNALATFPVGLDNFKGNTAADGAFIAQLNEWRAWRDEAWAIRNRDRKREARKQRTTRPRRRATMEQRRRWWREAQQRRRDRKKKNPKPQDAKTKAEAAKMKAIQKARADFIRRVYARYGDLSNGTKVGTPKFVTEDGKSFWQVKVTLKNGDVRTLQDRVKF